jgi:hypothetical protein
MNIAIGNSRAQSRARGRRAGTALAVTAAAAGLVMAGAFAALAFDLSDDSAAVSKAVSRARLARISAQAEPEQPDIVYYLTNSEAYRAELQASIDAAESAAWGLPPDAPRHVVLLVAIPEQEAEASRIIGAAASGGVSRMKVEVHDLR